MAAGAIAILVAILSKMAAGAIAILTKMADGAIFLIFVFKAPPTVRQHYHPIMPVCLTVLLCLS